MWGGVPGLLKKNRWKQTEEEKWSQTFTRCRMGVVWEKPKPTVKRLKSGSCSGQDTRLEMESLRLSLKQPKGHLITEPASPGNGILSQSVRNPLIGMSLVIYLINHCRPPKESSLRPPFRPAQLPCLFSVPCKPLTLSSSSELLSIRLTLSKTWIAKQSQ